MTRREGRSKTEGSKQVRERERELNPEKCPKNKINLHIGELKQKIKANWNVIWP